MKKISSFILHSILIFLPLWAASFCFVMRIVGRNLRQAILDLNSWEHQTITINTGLSSIVLASSLPLIQKEVTITTSGATPQVIDGSTNQFRLFAATAPLTVQNCTLQNGIALGGAATAGVPNYWGGGGGLGAGGAIYVAPSTSLTLSDITLQNNIARGGVGGIGRVDPISGDGGGGGGASFSSADPNANSSGTSGGGDNPGQKGSSGGTGGAQGGGLGGRPTPPTPGSPGSGSGGAGSGGGSGGTGFSGSTTLLGCLPGAGGGVEVLELA